MFGDSLNAIRGILNKTFPEVSRIYVSTMPDAFIRPSFFVQLATASEEHLSRDLYQVNMTWQVVYFAPLLDTEQPDVFSQLSVSDTLKQAFMDNMVLTYAEPAKKAAGMVQVEIVVEEGSDGIVIPSGTLFTTIDGVQFVTTKAVEVKETGVIDIPVEAVEAGVIGNVPAGAIVGTVAEIPEIISVTNTSPTTGGAEAGDPVVFHVVEVEGGPRDAEVYITVTLQTEMTRPRPTYDLMQDIDYQQEV